MKENVEYIIIGFQFYLAATDEVASIMNINIIYQCNM